MKEKNREEESETLFIPTRSMMLMEEIGMLTLVDLLLTPDLLYVSGNAGEIRARDTCDTYTSHLRLQLASDESYLAHV